MASAIPTICLDENVPHAVQTLLRQRGIDAKLAIDTMPRGTDDAMQLKNCTDNSWILVTFDYKDFWRLHWLWMTLYAWGIIDMPHAGILTATEEPPTPREWVEPLVQLLLRDAANFTGTMQRWSPSDNKWAPVPSRLP